MAPFLASMRWELLPPDTMSGKRKALPRRTTSLRRYEESHALPLGGNRSGGYHGRSRGGQLPAPDEGRCRRCWTKGVSKCAKAWQHGVTTAKGEGCSGSPGSAICR